MISRRKTGFGLVRAWRGIVEPRRKYRRRLLMWRALELFFRRQAEVETSPAGSSLTSQFLALTIHAPIYVSMSRHQNFRHLQRVQQKGPYLKAATASGVRGRATANAPIYFHQVRRANPADARPDRRTKVRLRQRIMSIIRRLQPLVPTTATRAGVQRAAQRVTTDIAGFAPGHATGAVALQRLRAASGLPPVPGSAIASNKPVGRRHTPTANRTVPANTLQFAAPRAARRTAASSNEHHSHHEHRRVLPIEIVYRESKQPPASIPQSREQRAPAAEMPQVDVSRLSSEVLRRISKQVRIERERLGRG